MEILSICLGVYFGGKFLIDFLTRSRQIDLTTYRPNPGVIRRPKVVLNPPAQNSTNQSQEVQ